MENQGKPWTYKLDAELLAKCSGLSDETLKSFIEETATYFGRTYGSIQARLKMLNIIDYDRETKQYQLKSISKINDTTNTPKNNKPSILYIVFLNIDTPFDDIGMINDIENLVKITYNKTAIPVFRLICKSIIKYHNQKQITIFPVDFSGVYLENLYTCLKLNNINFKIENIRDFSQIQNYILSRPVINLYLHKISNDQKCVDCEKIIPIDLKKPRCKKCWVEFMFNS